MVTIRIGNEVVGNYIEHTISKKYLENVVKDTVITKEKDVYGIESVTRRYKKGGYKVEVSISDNDVVSVDIIDSKLSIRAVTMNGIMTEEGKVSYTVESYNDIVFDFQV